MNSKRSRNSVINGSAIPTCFGQPRECVVQSLVLTVLTLIFVTSMILTVYLTHKTTMDKIVVGLIVESRLLYILGFTSNMYHIYYSKTKKIPTCFGRPRECVVQSFILAVSTLIFVTSMILTVYLTHKTTMDKIVVGLIVESCMLYILGFTSNIYHIYYSKPKKVPSRSGLNQATGISPQNSSSSGRPRGRISFSDYIQPLSGTPPPPHEIPMSEMSRILLPGTSQTTDSSTGESEITEETRILIKRICEEMRKVDRQTPSLRACVCRRRKGWLLSTERLLSTTCMGWCLGASYKEQPKATAIACAGGASSAFLANFLVNHHASQHGSKMLLRAGGFLSVAGIAWAMHVAIDEHPKAAIRACIVGALSVCLAESLILSDPPATVTKTSSKTKPITNINNNGCELYDACVDFPVKIQNQIEQIGKELKRLSKEYQPSKIDE